MRPLANGLVASAAAIMLACTTPAAQTVSQEREFHRVVLCNFAPVVSREADWTITELLGRSFNIDVETSARCEEVENRREAFVWVVSISRQRFRLGPHDSIWPTPAAEDVWDGLIGVREPYDVRIASTEVYSALSDHFAAEPVMLFGRNSLHGLTGPVLCPIVTELPISVQLHLIARCALRAFGYTGAFSDYHPTQEFELDAYESVTRVE